MQRRPLCVRAVYVPACNRELPFKPIDGKLREHRWDAVERGERCRACGLTIRYEYEEVRR